MKKWWYGLLMCAPASWNCAASAADIVAAATARQPVAVSAMPAAKATPAATLGKPRVVRGVSTAADPALLRVNHVELLPSSLKPESPLKPILTDDEPTSFAIERAAFSEFEPIPAPVESRSAAESLTFAPTPATLALAYQSEAVDGVAVIEGEGSSSKPRPCWYGGAEYLLWWTKDAETPPLLTTSDPADDGILGRDSTRILFGGNLDHGVRHGARFRLGHWFDSGFAVEGSFFFLAGVNESFAVASTDVNGVLARPFCNLNLNEAEDSQLIASPGLASGRAFIDAPSNLLGADLNFRCPIWCSSGCTNVRIDGLVGYRYLRLREGLYIGEEAVTDDPAGVNGIRAFRIDDRFDTQNRFHGGQVGVVAEFQRGKWSLNSRATVALGNTHQVVDIFGAGRFINANGTVTREQGGLLALSSNVGRTTRDQFSVVPEFGLTVGYQVTDCLRATAGYNFLFWSSVLRPGDQIDRCLDVNLIPRFAGAPGSGNPPVRPGPVVPLKDTTFWAQGLTFGLELSY